MLPTGFVLFLSQNVRDKSTISHCIKHIPNVCHYYFRFA